MCVLGGGEGVRACVCGCAGVCVCVFYCVSVCVSALSSLVLQRTQTNSLYNYISICKRKLRTYKCYFSLLYDDVMHIVFIAPILYLALMDSSCLYFTMRDNCFL